MLEILKHQKIHNALIYNKFPILHTTIGPYNFSIEFSPIDIPKDPELLLDYFADKVTAKTTDTTYRGKKVLASLPIPLFFYLLKEYSQFQQIQLDELLDLTTYIQSSQSEYAWNIFKSAGAEYVFPIKNLNSIQQFWIQLNINKDKNIERELIKDVFDALKPWLNVELFKKIQESTENTRENYLFDEEKLDRDLQARAADMLKKKNTPVNTDDIIEAVED